MVLRGHAYDSGGTPLPLGTPIRAFLDGVQYSNDSQVLDAAGSFAVYISGNDVYNATLPDTPNIKEGPNLGETVLLSAGDFTGTTRVFQETVSWYPGAVLSQDLHLASGTTSAPLKIQAVVTQPAAGGAPYLFLCNPTASTVALAAYYLQADVRGSYLGPNVSLAGDLGPTSIVRENLSSAALLDPSGDALKLVYRNPGDSGAGGRDLVVDRLEYNATTGGTLDWEPGNTNMSDAPSPGIGRILERTAACGDTNTASDFTVALEPGVTNASRPTVAITAPSRGQVIAGGAPFTIAWTMSDAAFASSNLAVWVNVTCQGSTTGLVAGSRGVTSVVWDVPNVAATGCGLQVDVVNPYGASASDSAAFAVQPSQPWTLIIAVLIILVVIVFLVLAWRNAHKKPESPGQGPPVSAPPAAPPAQGAAVPAAATPSATKACPRCHTTVKAEDRFCFFCGYVFPPSM